MLSCSAKARGICEIIHIHVFTPDFFARAAILPSHLLDSTTTTSFSLSSLFFINTISKTTNTLSACLLNYHHLFTFTMARTKKNKFSLGKFSHLPKSERPKMRDSKAVKEAKMRTPGDTGPPSKKVKGGVGNGGQGGIGKSGKGGKGGDGGKEEVKLKKVQASQQNIVPFDVFDRILCVGEGEMSSYSWSLGGCRSVQGYMRMRKRGVRGLHGRRTGRRVSRISVANSTTV